LRGFGGVLIAAARSCHLAASIWASARCLADQPAKRRYRGQHKPGAEHPPAYPSRVREAAHEPPRSHQQTRGDLDERGYPVSVSIEGLPRRYALCHTTVQELSTD
jgi:hypothetical protein